MEHAIEFARERYTYFQEMQSLRPVDWAGVQAFESPILHSLLSSDPPSSRQVMTSLHASSACEP